MHAMCMHVCMYVCGVYLCGRHACLCAYPCVYAFTSVKICRRMRGKCVCVWRGRAYMSVHMCMSRNFLR